MLHLIPAISRTPACRLHVDMMSCLKKCLVRPVNKLSPGLFASQRKRYTEDKPRNSNLGGFGNLRLEPEFTGNMPDDDKTPFINFNRMMNFLEADFTMSSMRNYVHHMIELNEVKDQILDNRTREQLGVELAAAHVVLRLGGRVRFAGIDRWIQRSGNSTPLPNYRVQSLRLQVADLTATKIRYEGLKALEGTSIKMLILKNCLSIDDFCLSRLYMLSETLEFLDISSCSLVTDNGLGALYKLRNLKYVRINDLPLAGNKSLMANLLLKENPDLVVLSEDLQLDEYIAETSQREQEQIPSDSKGVSAQDLSEHSQKQTHSEKS